MNVLVIIFWTLLAMLVVCFGFITLVGAPYVPTFERDLLNIFTEIKLPKDALVYDLGSGDGKLLVLAAKKGYRVVGYELNPVLWLITKVRLKKYPNATVKLSSMWRADITKADLVFTFLATKFMPKMERKLQREMKPGSYFASYVFALPNISVTRKTKNTHFYKF